MNFCQTFEDVLAKLSNGQATRSLALAQGELDQLRRSAQQQANDLRASGDTERSLRDELLRPQLFASTNSKFTQTSTKT